MSLDEGKGVMRLHLRSMHQGPAPLLLLSEGTGVCLAPPLDRDVALQQ
jgi:hypothetical protein